MDEMDVAAEIEEEFLSNAIERVRNAPLMHFPEGECLNCSAELEKDRQRFCDQHCQADWENRMTVKRRQQR